MLTLIVREIYPELLVWPCWPINLHWSSPWPTPFFPLFVDICHQKTNIWKVTLVFALETLGKSNPFVKMIIFFRPKIEISLDLVEFILDGELDLYDPIVSNMGFRRDTTTTGVAPPRNSLGASSKNHPYSTEMPSTKVSQPSSWSCFVFLHIMLATLETWPVCEILLSALC